MSAVSHEALLHAFAEAYNRHDIEALLSMVTEDCVFEAASGPQPWGTRHVGLAELRDALPWAWRRWPDARWEEATHMVHLDRGVSEWTFRGTEPDGEVIEVRGVDVFTFRDGRIARKDTFRKEVVVSSFRGG
ncbi:nuclear transport factor 2 family protein [Plastoroseomonas arctica]|uniref:Nuclear transport factor 2 family protein n=1 Tax=Plastoroseomonas arctica TaxID=1509237 RepID=A0AAF1JVP9_9PROT|nr:nuclear transport factor 2 family protein [Plastoroseomonas arctica]MBR0654544.1 nuclear transport factor 2 family protein [Plastoroseomonas arctica]